MKKRSFKNMKKLFLWQLPFQNKNCWHFKFLMNQLFEQRFIIFEKLRNRDKLLLNLRVVEVLLHFIEYCLDQLNNKHMKVAVSSAT